MDTVSHVLAREMGIPRESMIPPSSDMFGFPVVGTQAQYMTPARMDDVLEVRTWVVRVGRSSLSLRHEIVRIESDLTETLVVRGREDRVFIAQGPTGLLTRELTPRPRDRTPRSRETLSRFAAPEAQIDGLQPS